MSPDDVSDSSSGVSLQPIAKVLLLLILLFFLFLIIVTSAALSSILTIALVGLSLLQVIIVFKLLTVSRSVAELNLRTKRLEDELNEAE